MTSANEQRSPADPVEPDPKPSLAGWSFDHWGLLTGVCAAVFVVALALAFLCWRRVRKRRRHSKAVELSRGGLQSTPRSWTTPRMAAQQLATTRAPSGGLTLQVRCAMLGVPWRPLGELCRHPAA